METFLNFLSNNKEWLFSGVGASAIIGSVAYIFKTKQDTKEIRGNSRSPDPKAGILSETSGLLFKTTGLSGPGMAKLPVGSCSHSPGG